MLSQQQFFDACVIWLFAQNGMRSATDQDSSDFNNTCKYRNDSPNFASTRCVVGLFMKDDEFNPEENTETSYRHLQNKPTAIEHFGDVFVEDMQDIHDSSPSSYPTKLRTFCIEYNLDPTLANIFFPLPAEESASV